MTVDLPGHTTANIVSIQPPLSLPQTPQSPTKTKLAHKGSTNAGESQERSAPRRNKKGRGKNKNTVPLSTSGEDLVCQSNGNDSSGNSMRWSHQSQSGSDSSGHAKKRSSDYGVPQWKRGVSSSESDVSDSEASWLKAVCCKIRLEAHSCLARIFQVKGMLMQN